MTCDRWDRVCSRRIAALCARKRSFHTELLVPRHTACVGVAPGGYIDAQCRRLTRTDHRGRLLDAGAPDREVVRRRPGVPEDERDPPGWNARRIDGEREILR